MKIDFYCSTGGKYYVKEFISGLPPKTVKKVVRQLELLEKHGLNFVTHSGTMKKLQGYDIYEIKIDFNKICYRIFCVMRKATCWMLHMFIKKSNFTPVREIMTAMSRAQNLDLQLARKVVI